MIRTASHKAAPSSVLLGFLAGVLLLVSFAGPARPDQPSEGPGAIHLIRIEGAITENTSTYFQNSLESAIASNGQCLVVLLDTPGGLLSATRDIVQQTLNSPLPVIVYITPSGARGASAGTMLVLASHVAAMSPATHIGAAHPVSPYGVPSNKVVNEKIVNDTAAWVESIALMRGRNAEWAVSSVRESHSITGEKALELGVIEILATSLDELLENLHGREINITSDRKITLETRDIPRQWHDMSFSQSFFSKLGNPNLVFFLLALGIIGLYVEFSNPGLFLPGVVGTLALITALLAMQSLPISYGSLGLLLLGVILLVSETFVTSFGLLGLAGLASLLYGSLFLLDETQTDLRISRPMIYTTVGLIALISVFIGRLLITSQRSPRLSSQDNIVGLRVLVTEDIAPDSPGTVLLNGETWKARSDQPLGKGEQVVIKGISGLILNVSGEAGNTPPPEN